MDDAVTLEKLLGKWKLVKADDSFDVGDGVEIIIRPDRKMEYCIQNGLKKQIINLTFRLEGNFIISDQSSATKEERTQIMFDRDLLLLNYQDQRAWFKKVIE